MHPLHLLFTLLVIAIWGCNYVVIRAGLESLPPLFLCFARLFLTSIPAIFFIPRPKAPFGLVALYGLTLFALHFGLLFTGMNFGITPALASLVIQLQLFFTALLGFLFFNERISRWQLVGALLAFGGIGLAAKSLGSDMTLAGILLVAGSALSWAFGNVVIKKIGTVNILSLVVWASLIAWPPLLLLSLFVEGSAPLFLQLHTLSWPAIGAILYNTCLSTLFGFGMWSWLINRYPLKIVAPFTLLGPIFAILSSTLLGESLESWKVVAASLVISGIALNLLGPRLFSRSKPSHELTDNE